MVRHEGDVDQRHHVRGGTKRSGKFLKPFLLEDPAFLEGEPRLILAVGKRLISGFFFERRKPRQFSKRRLQNGDENLLGLFFLLRQACRRNKDLSKGARALTRYLSKTQAPSRKPAFVSLEFSPR